MRNSILLIKVEETVNTIKSSVQYFNNLNKDYLKVHKIKEDIFWSTYMGTSNDQKSFTQAEKEYKEFISNGARIKEIKKHMSLVDNSIRAKEKNSLLQGLKGWLEFFECNAIDNKKAADLQKQLIDMESKLFANRKKLELKHIDNKGNWVNASLVSASANLLANNDKDARKSSFEALHKVESWVLKNGFLDIIKKRNQFAQALGFKTFFDYKVEKNEKMTTKQLFEVLDYFEKQTQKALQKGLDRLIKQKGKTALASYNLRYCIGGDISQKLDPYMPFAKSLERWVQSFQRLGIDYKGANLTLDLLDRKGKYENGFMHGPVPCYYDRDKWIPAQINFTSVAKPDQIGSGHRALGTLFHEGGHAAHFSNIQMNAPCFSQEFPPTSMALAETQSMFCDSLLEEADWLVTYGQDLSGNSIPKSLIKSMIEATHPFTVFNERQILLVPYFEKALYQLNDSELTVKGVLKLAREWEQKILNIPSSPRPLLAVPHLQNQESAAAYHGYLLAHMAVYQTRDYFLNKYGYLTDNSHIGKLLAKHYWAPGNSITLNETLLNLTGNKFSGNNLAQDCNKSTNHVWNEAQKKIDRILKKRLSEKKSKSLNAHIKVVEGNELIVDNKKSDNEMIKRFEKWIITHYTLDEKKNRD